MQGTPIYQSNSLFVGRIPASVAIDNLNERQCAWAYSFGGKNLKCVSLSDTYHVDNTIDVSTRSTLVGAVPCSFPSLMHPATGGAVLVVGVNAAPSGSGAVPGHILALQLTGDQSTFASSAYWDFALPGPNEEFAVTQFPIVTDNGYPTIVFPSTKMRAYFYSAKP